MIAEWQQWVGADPIPALRESKSAQKKSPCQMPLLGSGCPLDPCPEPILELPLPVFPSHLHDKLSCVGACHGGALPCCQDPHGPDVERCSPKIAAQDDTLRGNTLMGIPKYSPLA